MISHLLRRRIHHRTVIVTAAVHQNLDPILVPTLRRESSEVLIYWHWAGVSPYTSSFDFAGTCGLVNQSLSVINCVPHCCGKDISLTYVQLLLPSSLRIVLSIAFVYSTHPPALVCSTVYLCFPYESFPENRINPIYTIAPRIVP